MKDETKKRLEDTAWIAAEKIIVGIVIGVIVGIVVAAFKSSGDKGR